MLPEVEQFIAALDAAAEKSAAARTALDDIECDFSESGSDCPRCKALAPVHEEYVRSEDAAWKLLTDSSDPLVRWIAEHCHDYAYEAQIVLEALPATMDELSAIATREGWCETWSSYVYRARFAGVLPETAPVEASRR